MALRQLSNKMSSGELADIYLGGTDPGDKVVIASEMDAAIPSVPSDIMNWNGVWSAGSYLLNDVVRDGNWVMIANKATALKPEPFKIGAPFFVRNDPIVTYTTINCKVLNVATQYTSPRPFWVEKIRLRVTAGHTYRILGIINPATDNTLIPLQHITATETGRRELPLIHRPFEAGTVLKLVVTITKPDISVSATISWNYSKPEGIVVPTTGVCIHSKAERHELHFHYTDADGLDQSATLKAFLAGDRITVSGMEWVVLTVTDVPGSSYVKLGVACAVQSNAVGVIGFTFDIMNNTDIEYGSLAAYWTTHGSGTMKGMLNYNAHWEAGTLDDTAYHVNAKLQDLTLSPDWDIVAFDYIDRSEDVEGDEGINFTYDHEDLAATYTNGTTTFTEIIAMTTPSRGAGVYEYAVSWRWKMSTHLRSVSFRFSDDGGSTWHTMWQESSDASNVHFRYYAYPKDDAVVGAKTLEFQAKVENGGDTVTVYEASVIIKRVA